MGVIKFGTDGWRGIIAQDFTFDNVRLCAQSVAEHLQDENIAHRGLIIGYDTRFASEHFAAAAAEVIAANGIKTYLTAQPTPTPVVSYGITQKQTAGAIIITASHNPALWNGFKFRTEQGCGAPPEVEADLERHLPDILAHHRVRQIPVAEGIKQGLIEYLDLAPGYLDHLEGLVDLARLRQSNLKVIVDSMYGAGIGYIKELLSGGSIRVIEINAERNPLFPGIQPEPIAVNLNKLSLLVRENNADVGLATDGDADRLGVIDERGNFLTQLQVFALLAVYFLEVRGERGPIVKTLTTTQMIPKLGEIYQVPVYETPVGFKYVAAKMAQEQALLGGEESGGYGYREHILERDGIFSGLCFLDLMTRLKRTPAELLDYLYTKVGPHYYHRIDVEFPAEKRAVIETFLSQTPPKVLADRRVIEMDTLDGFRFFLEDGSWLLIRFSGTEPLLRLYAESSTLDEANQLLDAAKRLVEEI
jgi:phosphomannomutase